MFRNRPTATLVPVRHSSVARRSPALDLEAAEGLQGYRRRHDVQIATAIALQRSPDPWWLPKPSALLSGVIASAALIAALFLASGEVGNASLTHQLDRQGPTGGAVTGPLPDGAPANGPVSHDRRKRSLP